MKPAQQEPQADRSAEQWDGTDIEPTYAYNAAGIEPADDEYYASYFAGNRES